MMALVPWLHSVPHSGLLYTLNRICDNMTPHQYNTMATSRYHKCQDSDNILKVLCNTVLMVGRSLKISNTTFSTMFDATDSVVFSRKDTVSSMKHFLSVAGVQTLWLYKIILLPVKP